MVLVEDPQWVLSLSEREQLAWYIAIGEQKGGIWDFDRMEWGRPIPPTPTLAILAEATGDL